MLERVQEAHHENKYVLQNTLRQFCRNGDAEAVHSLLEHNQDFDIDTSSKGKNTALHCTLIHNQQGLVIDYLISRGANVNAFNSKGYNCLIFSITNCIGTLALEKLIRAGSDYKTKIVRGKFSGLSLLEIALMYKNFDAAELLKQLQLEEKQERNVSSSSKRSIGISDQGPKNRKMCPICNSFVKFPSKLSFVESDQEREEAKFPEPERCQKEERVQTRTMKDSYISRKYLDQFLSHNSGAYEKLLRVEHHGINNKCKLRKEISESFSILHAVQNCCTALGLLPDKQANSASELYLENIFMIDLCAGKALTTALCGALFPPEACLQNTFLAIDKLPVHLVPHFLEDGNTSYLCSDIMKDQFFKELEKEVDRQTQQNKTAVLVGMHLCGNLSERAIEIFLGISSIKALVLCPCCLPKMRKKSTSPSAFESYFMEIGGEEYKTWSSFLKDKIQDVDPYHTLLDVNIYEDSDMHSIKNCIITAIRK